MKIITILSLFFALVISNYSFANDESPSIIPDLNNGGAKILRDHKWCFYYIENNEWKVFYTLEFFGKGNGGTDSKLQFNRDGQLTKGSWKIIDENTMQVSSAEGYPQGRLETIIEKQDDGRYTLEWMEGENSVLFNYCD